MSKLHPSPLLRYTVAIGIVLLILVLRLSLNPLLGDRVPFLFFIAPIVIAAWYGGIGPGLTATALSLVAVDYFLLPPVHSLLGYGPGGEIRVMIFALEGVLVSAIVGAMRNAIFRAKAELALQQTEEQLRLLIDSIEDYAIVMLDTEGYVVTWNHGAERLFGYRAAEIVGCHTSLLYVPDDAAMAEPEGNLRHAEGKGRWSGEQGRMKKDGSHFRVRTVITALRAPSGALRGFAELTHEIAGSELSDHDLHPEEELL